MSIPQYILVIAGVIGALLAIGASAATIYGSFKKTRDDANRTADRELIDTLKTSNDLLRTEKKENSEKLQKATTDIAELRGEMRMMKDVPLQQIAQALIELTRTNQMILQNQQLVFQQFGINGFNEPNDGSITNSKGGKQP